MKIFIDTNVFLSFFHLTSEDLVELEKLAVLIENKEIELYLPTQVVQETLRNRASKINDAFSPFKKHRFTLSFPAYCKTYEQYDQIREAIKECEKLHAELITEIQSDFAENSLPADLLIKRLFSMAQHIERTDEVFMAAERRVAVGNPPGKKGSLGDAINWESLLTTVPKKWPFYIIADDVDFFSPLDTTALNEFLIAEWSERKDSELVAYRNLSSFFKQHFPEINLTTEKQKEELISKLAASSNYATTHSLIAQLSEFPGFTQKQAEDLIFALTSNNQINWILSDDDVFQFYDNLINMKFFDILEHYDKFEPLMQAAREQREAIPF